MSFVDVHFTFYEYINSIILISIPDVLKPYGSGNLFFLKSSERKRCFILRTMLSFLKFRIHVTFWEFQDRFWSVDISCNVENYLRMCYAWFHQIKKTLQRKNQPSRLVCTILHRISHILTEKVKEHHIGPLQLHSSTWKVFSKHQSYWIMHTSLGYLKQ